MKIELPFSLSFHVYGLIIGVAIVVASFLIAHTAKKYSVADKTIEQLLWVGIIGGIIGSRLWHVLTDFHLYADDVLSILYIWQGGLSIVGAILGGLLGLWLFARMRKNKTDSLLTFLDLTIFGLPLAQAIGRLGNYFNQELYGLPASLPWKLYIAPEFRMAGFQNSEYFHPLFAYEAIALTGFGVAVWWLDQKNMLDVGSGRLALFYLLYYSAVRFLLDFLRIDTAYKIGGILGINQLVLIAVFCSALVLLKKHQKNNA